MASVKGSCWELACQESSYLWKGTHLFTSSSFSRWALLRITDNLNTWFKIETYFLHIFSAFTDSNYSNDGFPTYQDESWFHWGWISLYGCTVCWNSYSSIQWVCGIGNEYRKTSCILQAKRSPVLSSLGLCNSYMDPQDSNIFSGMWHICRLDLLCYWFWSRYPKVTLFW